MKRSLYFHRQNSVGYKLFLFPFYAFLHINNRAFLPLRSYSFLYMIYFPLVSLYLSGRNGTDVLISNELYGQKNFIEYFVSKFTFSDTLKEMKVFFLV